LLCRKPELLGAPEKDNCNPERNGAMIDAHDNAGDKNACKQRLTGSDPSEWNWL